MRRGRRRAQQQQIEVESIGETIVEMEEQRPRSLRDYALPNESEAQTSIARPAINANNFESKPSLIQMVQQSQFGGNAMEDPNTHLVNFMDLRGTIKINGISNKTIRLRLFPFSLYDKAKVWLNSYPPNTFTSWGELTKAFLNKYFLPEKWLNFVWISQVLLNIKTSHYMKLGRDLRIFKEDVPTMASSIGWFFKLSIMDSTT